MSTIIRFNFRNAWDWEAGSKSTAPSEAEESKKVKKKEKKKKKKRKRSDKWTAKTTPNWMKYWCKAFQPCDVKKTTVPLGGATVRYLPPSSQNDIVSFTSFIFLFLLLTIEHNSHSEPWCILFLLLSSLFKFKLRFFVWFRNSSFSYMRNFKFRLWLFILVSVKTLRRYYWFSSLLLITLFHRTNKEVKEFRISWSSF